MIPVLKINLIEIRKNFNLNYATNKDRGRTGETLSQLNLFQRLQSPSEGLAAKII